MPDSIYVGNYVRFDTVSKKEAAVLLGADNLVGDTFDIEFVAEKGTRVAWLKNRFGALVGFFDEATSRQISLYEARGWKCLAFLSFFAYSEAPTPGHYWGEVALVCYDPSHEKIFELYLEKLARRMGEGVRPVIDLSKSGIAQVIESNGKWAPTNVVPFPEKSTGTALLKTRRTLKERMIEEGRRGNKGCYFLSWIILLGTVAIIAFGLKACGVF